MKRVLDFLRSGAGALVLFVCFAAIGGALLYRSHLREKRRIEQMGKVEASTPQANTETVTREGQLFNIVNAVAKTLPSPAGTTPHAAVPKAPAAQGDAPPHKTTVLPLSLYTGEPETALSKNYAPFGRMIPCETIITLESSQLDTPVIALVTEDVWHNGKLIIPAGTEVHGRAAIDRTRERISASGKWVVVWRDSSPFNGTELVLNGIALDRERDDVTGEFGLHDGSAGLRGELVKSDNMQEIKLFAATFLSGMAGGLQQLRSQTTASGDLVQVPMVSGKNAALQGTEGVLNAYARQIQEAITRDGFYVRIPAGKQFYLYVTETIDQSKGVRGNAHDDEIWKNNHENNNDTTAAGARGRL